MHPSATILTALSGITPVAALKAWPSDQPIAALWSSPAAPPTAGGWANWVLLGQVSRTLINDWPAEALASLRAQHPRSPNAPPLGPTGGWLFAWSYDLGRDLEPRAQGANPPAELGYWPRMMWWRIDTALAARQRANSVEWHAIGDSHHAESLANTIARAPATTSTFHLGPLRSDMGRQRYTAAVQKVIDHLHAGDAYQINLAHRLTASFNGSTRALAAALLDRAQPWCGGYAELSGAGRAIISASPELFLDIDGFSRAITTRPMKGTRPITGSAHELSTSEKDRAELTMIVDLMRNDLTRVSRSPSVRVTRPRDIEAHGNHHSTGVLQATATVQGELRDGASLRDIALATFPGGSVTGAPKVRAMQIIDDLESAARGPYCGCLGFLSDDGHAALSIAIRTALVDRHTLHYSVGAGITVGSDPAAEWQETLDKAAMLASLCASQEPIQ